MKKVRLKPHNPKVGHRLMRLRVSEIKGQLYESGIWYDEPDDVAAQLALVNQDATMTDAPVAGLARAFDVLTLEEAEEVADLELRARAGLPSPIRGHRAPTRDAARQEATPSDTEERPTAKRVGARRAG